MKHDFTPTRYYYVFGPSEPALRIKSGDSVKTPTVDARGCDEEGNLIPENLKQRSPHTLYCERNPLVGPFYVEDAKPGDTLNVQIEKIKLNRPSGWSSIRRFFGSLTEEAPGRWLLFNDPLPERSFSWRLNLQDAVGVLNLPNSRFERIKVPLQPFIGSIGVAPPHGRIEPSLTPGEYGGNMDCPETRVGAILQLPVFVEGAYLSLGDVHAAQGDGELGGAAIETSAEVTLRVDVAKDVRTRWPRLEDDEYIMVAGSSRPLMEAYKIAHIELIEWLMSEHGYDKWEAIQVFTQVGRCRIGNIVNPNYTVMAKFPKKYLP